ncbi:MARVEL domain-containing protein 3 [Aplochiton taeniatus]
MPERSRYGERDEYKSRKQNTFDEESYDGNVMEKNRDWNKRDREFRRSDDHRRDRQDSPKRQRDTTAFSHNDPPDHSHHQGQSRVYREASPSPTNQEYYEPERRWPLYDLRYVLTARGLCQVMEVFVNLLIIICTGVPYSNNGGYRDLASLGGLYHYYYGGAQAFTGADSARVQELDVLFHQLKRPPYIFSMACGGALMAYACGMLALGILRVPYRWPPVLLGEALLNLLIGLGYIPALAFYFIKLKETYDNPICKEREQLYKSKGHQGFDCQLNGADIAGGLFAVFGVIVFCFSTVLAIRAFRAVRQMKKELATDDNNL